MSGRSDPLDLLHLRSLLMIAECGGFRRAAAALHVSQPTISQHVRLLEKRLNRQLITRTGGAIAFTESGAELLIEARRLLAVHDGLLARLQSPPQELSMVIGTDNNAADPLLPDLLSALRESFPHKRIRFRLDGTPQLLAEVDRGRVDLAVVLADASIGLGDPVGRVPLAWVTAPTFIPPLRPSDVWPLVAFEAGCPLRRRALHLLAGRGHPTEIAADATSVAGVLAATRSGLGVALLPVAGNHPDGLTALTSLPDPGTIEVHLVAARSVAPETVALARELVTEITCR